MPKVLAIIPARGGSRRIPQKNIKNFLGKPIIAYSIEAALSSKIFDEVMVSTDDNKISEIARQYGASVPFIRSPENSNDYATTSDVLLEVLNEYAKAGKHFDYLCCIYPTAPFVTSKKMHEAFDLLAGQKAKSTIAVIKFSHPLQRAFKVNDNQRLEYLWPENINTRTQDLKPSYYDAGQFYFLDAASFAETRKIFTDETVPYFTSELEAQDIDNEEDWEIAQLKYELLNKNKQYTT